jgi:hypothetical protein
MELKYRYRTLQHAWIRKIKKTNSWKNMHKEDKIIDNRDIRLSNMVIGLSRLGTCTI